MELKEKTFTKEVENGPQETDESKIYNPLRPW